MKPRWTVACLEYMTNRRLLFFVIGVGRQMVIIRSRSECKCISYNILYFK